MLKSSRFCSSVTCVNVCVWKKSTWQLFVTSYTSRKNSHCNDLCVIYTFYICLTLQIYCLFVDVDLNTNKHHRVLTEFNTFPVLFRISCFGICAQFNSKNVMCLLQCSSNISYSSFCISIIFMYKIWPTYADNNKNTIFIMF